MFPVITVCNQLLFVVSIDSTKIKIDNNNLTINLPVKMMNDLAQDVLGVLEYLCCLAEK